MLPTREPQRLITALQACKRHRSAPDQACAKIYIILHMPVECTLRPSSAVNFCAPSCSMLLLEHTAIAGALDAAMEGTYRTMHAKGREGVRAMLSLTPALAAGRPVACRCLAAAAASLSLHAQGQENPTSACEQRFPVNCFPHDVDITCSCM